MPVHKLKLEPYRRACCLYNIRTYLFTVTITLRLELSGRVCDVELGVSVLLYLYLADNVSVLYKLNLVAVRVDPDSYCLADSVREVPVRIDVHDRLIRPVRLVFVERVLLLEEHIKRSRLRAESRPLGLAPVLDSRPLEAAREPLALTYELPRSLARHEPARPVVVAVQIPALRIVVICPAPRRADRAALGREYHLFRELLVQLVVIPQIVVHADNVHFLVDRRVARIVRDSGREGSRVVPALCSLTHGHEYALADVVVVQRLLVAERPHYDRRIVAVALYKRLELFKPFLRRLKPPCLSHHEITELRETFKRVLALLIVRAPVGVRSHVSQQLQTITLDRIRYSLALKTVILVTADALDLRRLAVQEEAMVSVELKRSEAELHGHRIELLVRVEVENMHVTGVKIRVLDAPEPRVIHVELKCGGRFVLRFYLFAELFERSVFVALLVIGVLTVNRYVSLHLASLRGVVAEGHSYGQSPAGHLIELLRVHIHAPQVYRHALGLHEPHLAVDAAARVPPALMLIGSVHVNRDDVLLSVLHHVGDIDLKRSEAAETVRHQTAVEIHGGVSSYALEIQRQTASPVALLDLEALSVPAVVVGEIAEGIVVLPLRLLLDYEVVRQGDALPVPEHHLPVLPVVRRSVAAQLPLGLRAEVHRVLERRQLKVLIAGAELPTRVKIQFLSHTWVSFRK